LNLGAVSHSSHALDHIKDEDYGAGHHDECENKAEGARAVKLGCWVIGWAWGGCHECKDFDHALSMAC
jgi:hypothetical protein